MFRLTHHVILVSFCTLFSIGVSEAGDFYVDTSAESLQLRRQIRASQFLHHATFGPTIDEIDELADQMASVGVRQACSDWIDAQWALPATEQVPLVEAMLADDGYTGVERTAALNRYRHYAWWHSAVAGEDQLRQRVAWALIQILTTSEYGFGSIRPGNISGRPRWFSPASYYDVLIRLADGNYRDLLQEVTYHPVMGEYLSYLRNKKTSATNFPDENYARELMQLFTIGLYQLRPDGRQIVDANGNAIPTYDNHTIKELAKVFTGLTYQAPEGGNAWSSGNDPNVPMVMHNPRHEFGLKQPFDDLAIDGSDGDAEISEVLDYLFNHPNVGPFICYKLIQRLTRSNPSRAYLVRVVRKFNDNGQGVRGDMKAVVKAILLDAQAFQGLSPRRRTNPLRIAVLPREVAYSRLREPVVRYAGFLRSMQPTSDYATGRIMIPSQGANLNQTAYQIPSVFGFYDPDFQPAGGPLLSDIRVRIATPFVAAPEFSINTHDAYASWTNVILEQVKAGQAYFEDLPTIITFSFQMQCTLEFDWDDERLLVQEENGLEKLIDQFDLVYCSGSTPTAVKRHWKQTIESNIPKIDANGFPTNEWPKKRVQGALICVLTSVDAAVEF
ncbi:hypothetical protein Pla22_30620 [Rubripirellula amarantea]|uniref:DUF1800 domain-containing protein n=1 Tax=Rubripirellula amarantea TaxID=2527999 RepID=A0A5C5WI21_9BACT|nr:DUF1800 family protein [Rubripirellula amarantea]TWT50320.1 hypothetical protein Pla22_30620 [Rubripirellula amarantea]